MIFEKTDKQKQAIDLLASQAKDIMLYGGSRSGKSAILTYAIFVRGCKEPSRHLILRQNFNHAKRSVWMDTIPKIRRLAFPDLNVKYNKTDHFAYLPNGSEIWIGGLDDKDRTEKILGTEYSTIWFNEVSQMNYASIQMAKTRLAEKNNLTKKAYYDSNPAKKSHWSYWLFERQLDPIDEIPLKNPESYASLLMNPHDNIQNIDPDYLKLLESMPEEQRNRFLLGQYGDESEGQVYYAFRRDEMVNSTIVYQGTRFISMDFNVNPMTALIFQYVDNKFHIQDEVYLENSDTYKMAHELNKRGYSGLQVIPDSTGKNRKTSGQSDFQILEQNGFKILPTHNPFVTDRVNNVNRLLSSGRIIIDHKCKKLINDLEKVVWKNNELDQSGANKMLTHISDCLGYACWKLDPFTPTLKKVGLIDR